MAEMGGFISVQGDKLSEQVSRQLLSAIIGGQYRPGTSLPSERDLAAAFSASRIVIRESLSSLEAKGIITIRHGRGTIVNPVAAWNSLDPFLLSLLYDDRVFSQLVEVRRVIEPELAALAAARVTDEQLAELAPLADLPETDSMEEHVEHDTQFHIGVARAAHNSVLLIMLTSVSELLRESRRRSFQVPGMLAEAHAWHRVIFDAIAGHDPTAARQAMAAHLQQVQRSLEQCGEGR